MVFLYYFKPSVDDLEGVDTEEEGPSTTPKSAKKTKTKRALPTNMTAIASVPLDCLRDVSSVCLNFASIDGANPKDSLGLVSKMAKLLPSMRDKFWEGVDRAKTKLGGSLPLLDPVEDLGVKDDRLKKCLEVSSTRWLHFIERDHTVIVGC